MVIDLRKNKKLPGKKMFILFGRVKTKSGKFKRVTFKTIVGDVEPRRLPSKLAPETGLIQSGSVLGRFLNKKRRRKR